MAAEGDKQPAAHQHTLRISTVWKAFSGVLLHFHAWTYEGQVGLHDFVCAEAYSVCCQGDQQGENYSSLA